MRLLKFALFLSFAGCSGATAPSSTAPETKAAVSAAHAKGQIQGDPCAANGWYGDGECDTFCATTDTDCVPSTGGGPVVCAQFIEIADGVCSRPDRDPCRFQDPDCAPSPDPGTVDCDATKIRCETFAPVTCPAGQVPSVVNACYGPCVDASKCAAQDAGTACAQYIEVADGVCRRAPNDPCIFQDPDCTAK